MSTIMRITKKLARNWRTVLLIVFIIAAIGRESEITRLTDELAKAKSSTPATEVKTEEVVVEKEVEKVVEKQITPQSCRDLIALDDDIINNVSVYFDEIGTSASKGDLFTFIEDSTKSMEKLNKYISQNVDKRLNLKSNCLK